MPMDAGDLWVVITVIGALVLGVALVYGRTRAKKTTPGQDAAREAATRAQYEDPDAVGTSNTTTTTTGRASEPDQPRH